MQNDDGSQATVLLFKQDVFSIEFAAEAVIAAFNITKWRKLCKQIYIACAFKGGHTNAVSVRELHRLLEENVENQKRNAQAAYIAWHDGYKEGAARRNEQLMQERKKSLKAFEHAKKQLEIFNTTVPKSDWPSVYRYDLDLD